MKTKIFNDNDMGQLLRKVKQKKDPSKKDQFLGIGFNNLSSISGGRGFYNNPPKLEKYLLKNRVEDLLRKLNS